MKDDVLQAVIAGAKANGSWDARYGEVSIKEARSQTKGTQHMTRVEALAQQDADAIIIQYHEATIKRLEKRIEEMLEQLEQEPVEDVVAYHSDGTRTVRIAPKREWVGLTDKERDKAFTDAAESIGFCAPSHRITSKFIETKLKEKNT